MLTLIGPGAWEEEIKKSRFAVKADRVDSVGAAEAFVAARSDPGATHNCWAYRIDRHYRFSDDGEPAGTAGGPIFAAIEGLDLDHVVVLVTRYFGGTKLGAGGLARAYGGCAAQCLREAGTTRLRTLQSLDVEVDFDATGILHALLDEFGAGKISEDYSDQGLRMRIRLDAERCDHFMKRLQDATGGGARFPDQPRTSRPAR